MSLSDDQIVHLQTKANDIRGTIIDMLEDAGSGHTAGPLGMADIFSVLYFHTLNHRPHEPQWKDRDWLILSNGHTVPVRYSAMAHAGYFPLAECRTLRKFGSRLQGHPERKALPGLETTSGPLASGLGQAAGIAYGLKLDNRRSQRVYCMMSDGEMQSGNIWESAMFASAHKLSNIVGIIDRNYIQINGMTEEVMAIEPLREKWESFGWQVLEVDGHNITDLVDAFDFAKTVQDRPTIVIAHTIPGKGIKEIEYDFEWHGKPPSKEQEERWLKELRTLSGAIEPSHNS